MPDPKRKKRSQARAANTCFLDSSAIIALAFTADQNHADARHTFDELRFGQVLFVTTYFVFSEIMIYLQKRASIQTAIAEGERLLYSSQTIITEITPELHNVGWQIFKKYQDWKDLSYTDCLSFALMDEMGINLVFTFDSDFRTYGFTQVP